MSLWDKQAAHRSANNFNAETEIARWPGDFFLPVCTALSATYRVKTTRKTAVSQ
jgi:hypothetical protein